MVTQKKLRQMSHMTDVIEHKTKIVSKRAEKILLTLFLSLIILFTLTGTYCINYWHTHNRIVWQFGFITGQTNNELYLPYAEDRSMKHVNVLHSPIPEASNSAKLMPKISPKPKKEPLLPLIKNVEASDTQLDSQLEKVFDTVWLHESGRGTNKSGLNGACIAKGLINEVGYSPATGYCFDNEQEQHDTVVLWFRNRITGVKPGICSDIESCLKVYNNNEY